MLVLYVFDMYAIQKYYFYETMKNTKMNDEILIHFWHCNKYFLREFLRSIKISYAESDFYHAKINIYFAFLILVMKEM